MKAIVTLAVVVALLGAPVAYSKTSGTEKTRYCMVLGNVFMTAAQYRDMGISPKDSYAQLLAFKKTLGAKRIKKIVNEVYFSPAFTYAGGQPLMGQIYNACMGIRQYKPLR